MAKGSFVEDWRVTVESVDSVTLEENRRLRAEVARLRRGLEAVVEAEEWTSSDPPPFTWAVVEVYRALGRAPSEYASDEVRAEYAAATGGEG